MANWESNPAYAEAVQRLSRNLTPQREAEIRAITRSFADKDTRDRINFVTESARRKRDLDSLELGNRRLDLEKTTSDMRFDLKKDALGESKKQRNADLLIGIPSVALKGYFGNEEKKRDLLFARKISDMGKKYDKTDINDWSFFGR